MVRIDILTKLSNPIDPQWPIYSMTFLANKHYLRDKFEVLVQWTGYNEDSNTWEPFESMKDTTKFHEYLVKNKLKYLLTADARRNLANPA